MAKKNKDSINRGPIDETAVKKNIIEKQNLVDTLETNYMPYAMSVIVSRAIPEIDGFKPSHRKLLYTMFKMNLINGPKTKSANIVGTTMRLNPHGDMAIYETLVRLTRGNESLILPPIDSKGSFGKHYSRDTAFAASRYTECKLDKNCEFLFNGIDNDMVDFVDNYDNTMKEPLLLPVAYPTILVNSNQGIAVGMASNFCSFNLREVCEFTKEIIKNENLTVDEAMQVLKAPDFSTGGTLIYKKAEMRSIYESGRGSFKVRSNYTFDKKNNCIEVTEIPYSTTAEAIIDAIANLVTSNKIRDISDVRDETDKSGLKIAIDVKKNTDIDSLMNKLYKFTPLEDSFGCNFNVLINYTPKVLGVIDLVKEWLTFRVSCVRRGALADMKKLSAKLHLLVGLRAILLDIDKAIRIVRGTEEDSQVVPNLMVGFDIDKIQAEYVADIKLRNLNKEYIINRISEIDDLNKKIEELTALSKSDTKIKHVIAKQLDEVVKKYGAERRTKIVNEDEIETYDENTIIEDFNLKVFLTEQGYFKKIPLTSLRSNPEIKTKDDDFIVQEIETHNKAELLFISDKQNCYKTHLFDMPESKPSGLGDYLNNLLDMEEDEHIIYVHSTDDYSGNFLFCFENGKGAKVPVESYKTKTNRKRLSNAYSDKSKVCSIVFLKEDIDLVAFSNINKVLIFNTEQVTLKTSRTSQGLQIMKPKKGSFLCNVVRIEESGIKNFDYYKTKNIPGIGAYLRESDIDDMQVKLEI